MSFANRGPPAAFSRCPSDSQRADSHKTFGDPNIMTRFTLRASLLAILLASLAGLSASAQVIPPGQDFWTTPANGQTFFTFPAGDVEALCGVPPVSGWDHQLAFKGVSLSSEFAYDTVVARLDKAVFDAAGTAQTRVQVQKLSFASIAPQWTPCGPLTWQAALAGTQGVRTMVLHRTSPMGGFFNADLNVRVELRAFNGSNVYIGSLFYDFNLPDPSTGTPWSFGTNGEFRAGMTDTNDCIAVLRQKLSTYATTSEHYYYISDMIARGQCKERPN
jgi:hypothetical protein